MNKTVLISFVFATVASTTLAAEDDQLFSRRIAPILEHRCLSCHNDQERKGALSLQSEAQMRRGGESGAVVAPGKPDDSLLLIYVSGQKPEMPKTGAPLKADEVEAIQQWIAQGARWPENKKLKEKPTADTNWWSLQPLVRPPLPTLSKTDQTWVRNPIDGFVISKLREKGLAPSAEADRRTLIRRLYFDLIGLPPTPEEADTFAANNHPRAYEQLVDRLLESQHYGERWARHWLDVVHFGETHGYDKDQPRRNAWPYRDYVIRAFNMDKPYSRFVQEQIAGDVMYPGTVDGIEALGFIAAGPWDFIGHAEVPETKIDGKVARHLDRDDMVGNTIGTFASFTVQCAQCHNHKFDPITQEDYYRLQAVFAAVDRADKKYFADPAQSKRYAELDHRQRDLTNQKKVLDAKITAAAGAELRAIDEKIKTLSQTQKKVPQAEFGYHSALAPKEDITKWVQIDLGESRTIERLLYAACFDNFNNIGAGFGFPVRFKIELSDDPQFAAGVTAIVDHTNADVPNPGTVPQTAIVSGKTARFVRFTATKLVVRQNDYMLALAELQVFDMAGKNLAAGAIVTAIDSIEAPVRWRKTNLVDGYFPGEDDQTATQTLADLRTQRQTLTDRVTDEATRKQMAAITTELEQTTAELKKYPPPNVVFAGTVHYGTGNFVGTGTNGGKPRSIRLLVRGDVKNPDPDGEQLPPGAISSFPSLGSYFDLPPDHAEGARREALAKWLTDTRNPLTWRSIVNRVWLYHFGRGLVDTPNDFGRMGQTPTHPELLDWLAAEFRDSNQSLKQLHRLMVTSATYRQTSEISNLKSQIPNPESQISNPSSIDSNNAFYWRMNRRKLEAEAVRDSVLFVSGKLNPKMGGESFQDFVIEHPAHSPHYEYGKHDPEDPKSHRRSVYRFLVRSQPQPFMTTLDCADPSMRVDKRNESVSPLQALALLNNGFMVTMAKHFATKIEQATNDKEKQVIFAFRTALGRQPTATELTELRSFADANGLPNLCRVLFNVNEFSFVD